MKECSKCHRLLSFSLFYRNKNYKDGYSYWCSSCVKDNVRQHRQDPEYRKKQCEWNNKWRFRPENREKVLAIRRKSQNNRNRILRTVGFVTDEIRLAIHTRDNFKCLSCSTPDLLTIDHIKSVLVGGKTELNNLQTLCRSCNTKKQQKTIDFRMLK